MKNISKSFSGVKVLDNAQLEINEGEVHALMGANGAGKSTLMKILTGIYQKDEGAILLGNGDGELKGIEFQFPLQALEKGISMIYQEFNLVDNLSIAENIFLGREPINSLKHIDWKKMFQESKKYLEKIGMEIDTKLKVGKLSTAQKQSVEIAKCLSLNSRIIIMDEPTASLTDYEIKNLFNLIKDLKKKGYSIIYISHRMEEIFSITDRITVMKDGCYVNTLKTSDTTENELVRLMVGKEVITQTRDNASKVNKNKETIFSVKNVSSKSLLQNINFNLNKGEILGFFGLVGAGRTELARVIFGIDKMEYGEVWIEGEMVNIKNPYEATRHHIGLVPEDRKDLGLILNLPIKNNMSLTKLRYLNPFILRKQLENRMSTQYINDLSIATSGPNQITAELSGGNQQKVVIAKWLSVSPKILILDEPTRGIDIGAKNEIYKLMGKLVDEGMSIIMISSELPEILNVSDRVIVMHEGKITFDHKNIGLDQETILQYAMGVRK
ncbi:ribose transport system ATP-binding protein [Pullulanibacillus pueri]|nr:sugar ABC transporter ATP-binding protein [Pullulanibacillus pueri]MBM7683525.1 ribose transport system ATP-binding protein [Pullulanibacillus pueri]